MLAGSHRDPRFSQGELIGITKDDNWFEIQLTVLTWVRTKSNENRLSYKSFGEPSQFYERIKTQLSCSR
jgi:hypothetical protein